jgi:hypothetical protein
MSQFLRIASQGLLEEHKSRHEPDEVLAKDHHRDFLSLLDRGIVHELSALSLINDVSDDRP